MYKIVTVCGMGWGTSLMLKMNVNDLLRDHGLDRDFETVAGDLGSVKTEDADIIVGTRDMKRHLDGVDVAIILLDSVTDKDELKEKLFSVIKEMS